MEDLLNIYISIWFRFVLDSFKYFCTTSESVIRTLEISLVFFGFSITLIMTMKYYCLLTFFYDLMKFSNSSNFPWITWTRRKTLFFILSDVKVFLNLITWNVAGSVCEPSIFKEGERRTSNMSPFEGPFWILSWICWSIILFD